VTAAPVVSLPAARRNKSAAEALTSAERNDDGNGHRLLARHGHDLRFSAPENAWYVWGENRWVQDRTKEVFRRAVDTLDATYAAGYAAGGQKGEALCNHAGRSKQLNRVRAMIEFAGAERDLVLTPDQFDNHPMLLNCANGVVDLTTGELKPHDRALLMTKLAPVGYSETARCPRWLAFLDRIFGGDAELVAYVQRAIGYTLTGDTREQCLHLLHGAGQNGKSTFLELLGTMLGPYAMSVDFSTFLERPATGAAREDLARLRGARFVRSSESGEGKRFNEVLIKSLTGNEVITARFLYQATFEFTPTFKLWFAANHKPVIRGTDYAIWRRMRLIPFTVTIPEEERDADLTAKLRTELPGILAWAVQGCLEWRHSGLNPPASVVAATTEYRSESDVLGAFLEECTTTDAGEQVLFKDLYAAYGAWCRDGNEHSMTATMLGRRLEERGFTNVRGGHGAKYRRGLRLRDTARSTSGPGLF
jgi:putative DNA primase/helicase